VTFNRKARHTQLNGTGGFPTNVIKEINNMFKSEDDSIRARVYTNGYSDYCFVVFGRWNQDVIVKAILDNMSKVFTKNTDGKELKIAECIATHIKDQKPEPVEFTEENGKIRLENTNGSNRNSLFAKEKFIVIK